MRGNDQDGRALAYEIGMVSPDKGCTLFIKTCAAFFNRGLRMKLIDYFYGLGGRDTVPSEFCDIFRELSQIAETGEIKPPLVRYLAVSFHS